MKITLLIIPFLLLPSCSVALSQKGALVREFSNTDPIKGCKFLGVATGSFGQGAGVADDQIGALNDLKNNIAGIGGNFFKTQHVASDGISTTITAEAFRCRDEMHSDELVEKEKNIEGELVFLKKARDKGLITEDQYKTKVNKLLEIE